MARYQRWRDALRPKVLRCSGLDAKSVRPEWLGYLTPVMLLKKWLNASSIKEGWLFRRIYGHRIGPGYLHPFTINRIIQELAEAAGAGKIISPASFPDIRCVSAPPKTWVRRRSTA